MNDIFKRLLSFGVGCALLTGVVALALFSTLHTASAQIRIEIGPSFGVEYGVPLSLQRTPGEINRYGITGTGVSRNITGWGGVDLLFTDLLARDVRSLLRLNLAFSDGRFLSDPFTYPDIDSATGTSKNSQRDFQVYASVGSFRADLIPVVYSPLEQIDLGAGLWGAYRLNSGFYQTERILAPDTVFYDDGSTETIVNAGSDLGEDPFQFGLILLGGIRIPLWNSAALCPQIYSRIDLTAVLNNVDIRRSLSGGLAVAVQIDPTTTAAPQNIPPPPLPPSSILPSPPPKPPRPIVASVDLYSKDSTGTIIPKATVKTVTTLFRMHTPVIPLLFFDKGTSILPKHFTTLSPQEVDDFWVGSLARLKPDEIHCQILNVLGQRLQNYPDALLTLHGCATRDEPPGTGIQRANRIKEYLIDTWNIAPSRIEIRDQAPVIHPTLEERYVYITSDTPDITAPLVVEWILNSYRSSTIGLTRNIEAEAGIRRWALKLRQNDHQIAGYSSDDESWINRFDTRLQREGSVQTELAPKRDGLPEKLEGNFQLHSSSSTSLTAELTVEDSLGNIVTVHDILPVEYSKQEDQVMTGTTQNEVLTTIIPYSDTSEDQSWRVQLKQVAAAARDGVTITITTPGNGDAPSGWKDAANYRMKITQALLEELAAQSVYVRELRITEPTEKPRVELPELAILASGVSVKLEQRSSKGR